MLAVFIGAEFGTRMDNPAIYKSGEYGIQIKVILASSTDSLADLPELEFVIDLLKEKIPAIVPLNLIFWYLNVERKKSRHSGPGHVISTLFNCQTTENLLSAYHDSAIFFIIGFGKVFGKHYFTRTRA